MVLPLFVEIKESDMKEQASLGFGEFVDVHHKDLAFGGDLKVSKLYVRQEIVDLWTKLEAPSEDKEKRWNLRVSGPPGTGKSTEVWAWAMWKSQQGNGGTTVTWFHFSKNHSLKLELRDGKNFSGHSAEINDIGDSGGIILIVDGVTKDDYKLITRACSSWRDFDDKNRSFVTVSSVSVVVAVEQGKESFLISHIVPSWTLEQYEKACEDESFFTSVMANLRGCPGVSEETKDPTTLVHAKYFYAGGCARWMFEFTLKECRDDFKVHLGKVSNYLHVLGEAGGDTTKEAVNHLRGVTLVGGEEKFFFVSQYAVDALACKCGDKCKFIIASYKKAEETQNPSYRGWIFEFDVDYQLTEASKSQDSKMLTVTSADTKEEKWKVTKYIDFDSAGDLTQDLAIELKGLKEGDTLWAKPTKWNQKAYDFVRFWCSGTGDTELSMVPVNATWARTHTVKLEEVYVLGEKLAKIDGCGVSKICFEFLLPLDMADDFQIGSVTGDLRAWKNLEGKQWKGSTVGGATLKREKCIDIYKLKRTSQ
jgi:hypothetical protein